MYAKELLIAGEDTDFLQAGSYFEESAKDTQRDKEEVKEACLITAAAARRSGDELKFFKYATKVIASGGCSEICCELGSFYYNKKDFEEAAIWFYNACYQTEVLLALKTSGKEPMNRLADCYDQMGLFDLAESYRKEAEDRP